MLRLSSSVASPEPGTRPAHSGRSLTPCRLSTSLGPRSVLQGKGALGEKAGAQRGGVPARWQNRESESRVPGAWGWSPTGKTGPQGLSWNQGHFVGAALPPTVPQQRWHQVPDLRSGGWE